MYCKDDRKISKEMSSLYCNPLPLKYLGQLSGSIHHVKFSGCSLKEAENVELNIK